MLTHAMLTRHRLAFAQLAAFAIVMAFALWRYVHADAINATPYFLFHGCVFGLAAAYFSGMAPSLRNTLRAIACLMAALLIVTAELPYPASLPLFLALFPLAFTLPFRGRPRRYWPLVLLLPLGWLAILTTRESLCIVRAHRLVATDIVRVSLTSPDGRQTLIRDDAAALARLTTALHALRAYRPPRGRTLSDPWRITIELRAGGTVSFWADGRSPDAFIGFAATENRNTIPSEFYAAEPLSDAWPLNAAKSR